METLYICWIIGSILLGCVVMFYGLYRAEVKEDAVIVVFIPDTQTSTVYFNDKVITCSNIWRLLQILQDAPRTASQNVYWTKEDEECKS